MMHMSKREGDIGKERKTLNGVCGLRGLRERERGIDGTAAVLIETLKSA